MRSFEEFLLSIKGEDVAAIINDADLKAREVRKGLDPHSRSYQGNQIWAVSFTISLELLAMYHEWLRQDIRGQD